MQIPLNMVQIFTNKGKEGKYFYNVVLTTLEDKKYSISSSVLFLDTKEMNLFLSDTYDFKIYSYSAKKNLSGKALEAFKKGLASGDFSKFKPVSEQSQENGGQEFDDDIPF